MTRLLSFVVLAMGLPAFASAAAPSFERDIAPILSTHCLPCHGPRKQESGLRLDSREAALKGGDHGSAYVPGQAADSPLVMAVEGRHPEVARMPHKRDPLAPREIAALRTWIAGGAELPRAAAKRGTARAEPARAGRRRAGRKTSGRVVRASHRRRAGTLVPPTR